MGFVKSEKTTTKKKQKQMFVSLLKMLLGKQFLKILHVFFLQIIITIGKKRSFNILFGYLRVPFGVVVDRARYGPV